VEFTCGVFASQPEQISFITSFSMPQIAATHTEADNIIIVNG
jgi:hypothetical protein